MKKIIFLLLLIAFCGSVGQGLYLLKQGFSSRRIYPINQIADGNFSEEVDQVLQQPFTYLGRGRQCFAFSSQDNKYILKFPRTDIYKTPLWVRAIGFKSVQKRIETAARQRKTFVLNSFQLCYDTLKDQTSLIALHIGQSEPKGKFLTLIDALGCTHRLPLEKVSFLLQYKQPIWSHSFVKSLQSNDRAKAKKILDAFIDVVVERANKGILNKDRSFLGNYGFDGEKAYQIDVGSFYQKSDLSQEAIFQKSVRESLIPVQQWLETTDPLMKLYLDEKLRDIL